MNKEEQKFWAATLILAGMAANYHHGLSMSNYWATNAVRLADYLLQVLSDSSDTSQRDEQYQRDGQTQ